MIVALVVLLAVLLWSSSSGALDPSHAFFARSVSLRGGGGDGSNIVANADADADANADVDSTNLNDNARRRRFRTVHVQIIHRHGDRTPITTMKDEKFWSSTLVEPNKQAPKIAIGTTLRRNDHDAALAHNAQGRGPFGKLTMMGLLQMVDLGTKLREELEYVESAHNEDSVHESPEYCSTILGSPHCPYVCRSRSRPLNPSAVRVISTDFERTIQSVRGLLVGMFPDGIPDDQTIDIDCRHTRWMIPDPQPRSTREQELLEVALSRQPHILEREAKMKPLAVRATQALRDQLDDAAFHMSYGVGEDEGNDDEAVLPWAQLSEVTKCLKVRGLLSESITLEDQEAIVAHTAWRWFESMKDSRLCYLAMHQFCQHLMNTMQDAIDSADYNPPVVLYSAHDSTLIGTLCSLRLAQPSLWPPYASYLKIELIRDEGCNDALNSGSDNCHPGYYVRFVFNGNVLASQWYEEPKELIPLDELAHYIQTEGAVPSEFADEQ